ncbi:MAG: hypothetical protein RLZZ126_1629 [Pseudomonadota bacterium]|jgi:hypothetical protein
MIGLVEAFSASYAEARVKFLEAAARAGCSIESHEHPLKGRDGETLAMDVARLGAPDAERVMLVSSACHGVEGYCGSGVQVFSLHDEDLLQQAQAQGVALLFIHALNPYGFSHIRRVTHENVDLNRNFHDFSKPLPVNAAYRDVAKLLVPADWPPGLATHAATAAYIATRGMKAFQAATSQGQHEFPQGLFFGGTAPTWSNTTLRGVLRQHAGRATRLGWVDVHTGLGPSGHGERIFAGPDRAEDVARARAWWDGGGATPVTSIYDGSSTSAYLTGLMWMAAHQECPGTEVTSMAMEYGTQPMLDVMNAMRGEQWLQLHPKAPQEQAKKIKQQMLEAFYTDTDAWKGQVISQARQAILQAIQGLAA